MHSAAVQAAIHASLPQLKAETDIMKLELGIIMYIARIQHKDDGSKAFTEWLRSLDDEISKEIAFTVEMAVYHLDMALDNLSQKEK